MDMSIDSFLTDTVSKAAQNGTKVILAPTAYVRADRLPCSGFYASAEGLIKCAVNRPVTSWLPVLVHETCHMDQDIEQCYEWVHCFDNTGDRTHDFFEWLNGNMELTTRRLNFVTALARDLELDCEKRAVRKIKKYNLPLNIEEYIKKANSYVFSYNYMKESRKWVSVSKETDITWKEAPKTFRQDYNNIPKRLYKAFTAKK